MASQWFYILNGKAAGPVSQSELRQLSLEGKIARTTHVRKGAEGEWMLAHRVNRLFDPPKADWHFSRDGDKAGPVSVIALQKLALSGKLSPTDLVWKAGMPNWRPASTIPVLSQFVESSTTPSQPLLGARERMFSYRNKMFCGWVLAGVLWLAVGYSKMTPQFVDEHRFSSETEEHRFAPDTEEHRYVPQAVDSRRRDFEREKNQLERDLVDVQRRLASPHTASENTQITNELERLKVKAKAVHDKYPGMWD
jgi:hypothetical protein